MNQITDFKDLLNNPDIQLIISELEKVLPDILKALSAVLIVVGIICSVLLLIGYILRSIAIARIGHRRGIPLWGLAWIPGLRLIIMGGIADDHDKKTVGRRHGFRVLLPVLLLIGLIAGMVSSRMFSVQIKSVVAAFTVSNEAGFQALGTLFRGSTLRTVLNSVSCIAYSVLTVFRYIAVYKILESCKRKYTFLNMILYLIVPFAAPIVLLAVSGSDSDKKKKKKKVLPPPEEEEYDSEEAAPAPEEF